MGARQGQSPSVCNQLFSAFFQKISSPATRSVSYFMLSTLWKDVLTGITLELK
jgi:hypothetical protein